MHSTNCLHLNGVFNICVCVSGHPQGRRSEVLAQMFSLRLCHQGPSQPDQAPEAARENNKRKQ